MTAGYWMMSAGVVALMAIALPGTARAQAFVVEEPPVLPVADPVVAAIQYADRALAQAHCTVERDLQEAGAWPPLGRDLTFYRALCTFRERTRDLRVATRHQGVAGITTQNIMRAGAAADNLERITLAYHIPVGVDQLLQDALDMVAYLRAGNG